ncbi:MAG: TonB-dependent receptor [Rhodospirillaceae bacterium]|nr:TonB-dependent receptor [Rhodospirillaceae bacterium]
MALFNIEGEKKDREVLALRAPGQPRIALEDRDDLKTETILRGTFDWELAQGQTAKAGVEGAFNTQDTELNLFTVAGGVSTRVPIFNNDTTVKEYRSEIFATHRWDPNTTWQVESGLTVELSQLKQNGNDLNSSRSLQYVKPTVDVFYKPTASDKLWVSAKRDVSQLDFLEFIATVRAEDRTLDQGNPQLLPEKSWDLETGVEHKLADNGGFLSLRGFYRDVSDVKDKIAFRGILSQPGNIGSGREYGAEAEASLKLKALGLWDGSLTTTYLRRATRVTDPFSGRARRFGLKPAYEFSFNYKHEVKPLDTQLTFIVTKNGPSYIYDLDRVETNEDEINFSIFADTTLYREFSLHYELGNVTNRVAKRNRTVYAVNAIDGRIGRFDSRKATWGRYWLLSAKGQF